MSLTLDIAAELLALWQRPLPEAVAQRARIGILDTLGVTLAGSAHPGAAILEQIIVPSAAAGPATLVGDGRRLSALDAAHLNGTASHLLDFDDSNSQLHGHPSVAVLPAVLALAEEYGSTGDEVLRAYACGVEACGRLGMGVGRHQYTHGWHPTTTIGIFGGVAGAALIAGLNQQQIAVALGIAASMASGIKSNFGTMTKPLIVGQAARNAVLAVKLAQGGFTASLQAFEHHHGYLNVFNRDAENYDTARILANWGEPYVLQDMGIKQKRYPCCYACLPVVDGVERLMREHGVTADDIASVELGVHAIRYPHINVPDPADALGAKFSVHYCVARVLQAGRLSIEDFEGDGHRAPTTRELMARTRLYRYERENTSGAEVRLLTHAGQTLETYVELALGAKASEPLPLDIVKAKFDDAASRAIPAEQAEALYQLLTRIETIADIRDISRLLGRTTPSYA